MNNAVQNVNKCWRIRCSLFIFIHRWFTLISIYLVFLNILSHINLHVMKHLTIIIIIILVSRIPQCVFLGRHTDSHTQKCKCERLQHYFVLFHVSVTHVCLFLCLSHSPFIRPKLGKLHEATCMVSIKFSLYVMTRYKK